MIIHEHPCETVGLFKLCHRCSREKIVDFVYILMRENRETPSKHLIFMQKKFWHKKCVATVNHRMENTMSKVLNLSIRAAIGAAVLVGHFGTAQALVVEGVFAGAYTATSLGSVPGLPPLYGGLTFLDNNTILIGGAANGAAGNLRTIGVTRGAGNHVTGFTGSAVPFGTVGIYNDGGVTFGPGGVLFTSQWPVNRLGQTKPGSTVEDKVIDLAPLGVQGSHAAINFVPVGFGGSGQMKLVSWSGGAFYTATYAADGSGTYDITSIVQEDLDLVAIGIQALPGGPEGFVYIAAGNAGFANDSMLVSDYSSGRVSAYDVDANGNPLVATRRDFLTGLSGAEGAAIDPVTGDFLFSTFGGGNQVVVVQGFLAPDPDPNSVPEPGTLFLAGAALLGLFRIRRRAPGADH